MRGQNTRESTEDFPAAGQPRQLAEIALCYQRALKRNPRQPQALVGMSLVALSSRQTEAAVKMAAAAVAGDSRYAASCLAPARLWGVVAIAADTMTARVSIRTATTERERIGRALREEVVRRLHTLQVFLPPD